MATKKTLKESLVDTGGNMTYSLVVGAGLDYAAGLGIMGIITSRVSATALNFSTGALYGKWRNLLFEKTARLRENKSIKETLRKTLFYGASFLAQLTSTSNYGYSEIADHLVDTGKAQDTLTDLVAFNTFQVPVYAIALSAGSLVSDHKVDSNKVLNGAKSLASISPFIGPTMGWFMDRSRKLFRLKSASEKAQIKLQGEKNGSCN